MTYFYIGSSPSMAEKLGGKVMVSANALRKRKSDFSPQEWILDSGAFTEISKYGHYRSTVEEYAQLIERWKICGDLKIAVSQDFMCEAFVLNKTGLTISEHQRLTIERYDSLLKLTSFPVMPVLQGFCPSDYLQHLFDYGDRLFPNQWVGIGSVCKRNSNPSQVKAILKIIKLTRPDLRIHGFGLKATALEDKEIADLLYSCDSMAWSYPLRFKAVKDSVQNQINIAQEYRQKVNQRISGDFKRSAPPTAGAGNGQGRKRKWKSGKTIAVRIPEVFAEEILNYAHLLDEGIENVQNLSPEKKEA